MSIKKQITTRLFLILVIVLGLILRTYALDKLPGEMWGDVIEHYQRVRSISNGQLLADYWGGDGPLFSYIALPMATVIGLSFFTLKLTTVFLGLLLIIIVYSYSLKLLRSKSTALIASFLTAVSFWSVSFSRQAKPFILVPLFVILTLRLLLNNRKIIAGLILGLGMYSQSAFWGMSLLCFYSLPTFFIFQIASLPIMLKIFNGNGSIFNHSSYIGEKLLGAVNLGWQENLRRFFVNIYTNLLSFFYRGDLGFRHTIPGQPHLDFLSSIFFLVGFFIMAQNLIKTKVKKPYIYFF